MLVELVPVLARNPTEIGDLPLKPALLVLQLTDPPPQVRVVSVGLPQLQLQGLDGVAHNIRPAVRRRFLSASPALLMASRSP